MIGQPPCFQDPEKKSRINTSSELTEGKSKPVRIRTGVILTFEIDGCAHRLHQFQP